MNFPHVSKQLLNEVEQDMRNYIKSEAKISSYPERTEFDNCQPTAIDQSKLSSKNVFSK